jgi:hypothetical protein
MATQQVAVVISLTAPCTAQTFVMLLRITFDKICKEPVAHLGCPSPAGAAASLRHCCRGGRQRRCQLLHVSGQAIGQPSHILSIPV